MSPEPELEDNDLTDFTRVYFTVNEISKLHFLQIYGLNDLKQIESDPQSEHIVLSSEFRV